MADVFSKEKRSWVMSRIRGKNTKIELLLAKALRKSKIPYRKHPRGMGNPDFLVSSDGRKILVFVDGDFWHGWDYAKRKAKLNSFWRRKIEQNMRRDKRQRALLRKKGWTILRLWEHEVTKNLTRCIKKIKRALNAYN
ncbi:MAG: very short patch repair endonuclease [Candidatus Micrarchaeota archaeon]